jgi:hypothetical protein
MDIHRPKPWHGLREFLKEYLIIFVGVLTALAAEQAVEGARAQEAVGALREGIRRELIVDRAHWELNRSRDACAAQRLDAILAWATTSPPTALIAPGRPEAPGFLNLHSSAWDAAKANPASTHLPIPEHTLYAEEYDGLAGWQRQIDDERQVWTEIAALLEQGDSAEDKRALRKLAVIEKVHLAGHRHIYDLHETRYDALHIPPHPLSPAEHDAAMALCAPLVTADRRPGRGG